MKKHSTIGQGERAATRMTFRQIQKKATQERLTIGLDLGDRKSHYCILDARGGVVGSGQLATTKTGLNQLFERLGRCLVALEVGTHSPWVSWHLTALGHEVLVADPRKLAWITQSRRKNDRIDARKLARLARLDRELLSPVRHRSQAAQEELAVIRARAALVDTRTDLINAARGLIKPLGERLKSCDGDAVGLELAAGLPEPVRRVVAPMLQAVEAMTEQILVYDEQIEQIAERHPEIELLMAVYGVGRLVSLTYILTIEDALRFAKSREVGPFVGLVPGENQSGDRDPHMPITKEGDRLLRRLLVQSAHCILRHNAPDSDLRRWGLGKLKAWEEEAHKRGSKKSKGKKRVLVAVARKLAVLLHHLWVSGEVYDPLYEAKKAARAAQQAA